MNGKIKGDIKVEGSGEMKKQGRERWRDKIKKDEKWY